MKAPLVPLAPLVPPAPLTAPSLSLPQRLLLAPIRFYQRFLSPLKAHPSCRFHPSCSRYAAEAIALHGAPYGLYLALRRLLKCHPFHPGGFDPVPPRRMS